VVRYCKTRNGNKGGIPKGEGHKRRRDTEAVNQPVGQPKIPPLHWKRRPPEKVRRHQFRHEPAQGKTKKKGGHPRMRSPKNQTFKEGNTQKNGHKRGRRVVRNEREEFLAKKDATPFDVLRDKEKGGFSFFMKKKPQR